MRETTPARAPRFAGLDGLRAVAVILVVVYHLFPGFWLGSGFVGVDVFFVISGFLITSLLLRELASSGRIALRAFWTRRARRLLPALFVVVAVSASAAWIIGGDVLVGLGRQVLGAATFSYNWLGIASGTSYFTGSEPELLRNLWSLAVEEQFYLFWPLLLPLVALLPSRRWRVAASLIGVTASAAWATALVLGGAGITRAYYGTDTHAFGLLLGVALAFTLARADAVAPHAAPRAAAWIGTIALAGVVGLAAWPGGEALYPGLPLAASVLTVVAIWAAVRSSLGRRLDVAPLRWIGERSYGIYLWHWPLVVLVTLATTGQFIDSAIPVGAGAIALVLTLALSALSYRFIEQPVRRLGFRGTARALRSRFTTTPTRRFGVIATAAAGALVVACTTAAVASAPPVSSSEAYVAEGQAALKKAMDAASATPAASAIPAPSPTVTPTPTPDPDGRPVAPEPQTIAGDRVSAIGDSVMLASAGGLLARLPGIQIDAAVSRSMWAGGGIVSTLAAQGALREFVVLGLGTNGPVDDGALTQIYDTLGPDRTLVLVTAAAPRDWIPGVNSELATFAADHPRVVIADWSTAIAPHADYLASDGIHPGTSGGAVYADTVAAAVDAVANQRADAAYQVALIAWATERAFGGVATP